MLDFLSLIYHRRYAILATYVAKQHTSNDRHERHSVLFLTGCDSITKFAGQYTNSTKRQVSGKAKLKFDDVMASLRGDCGTEARVKTDATTAIKLKNEKVKKKKKKKKKRYT